MRMWNPAEQQHQQKKKKRKIVYFVQFEGEHDKDFKLETEWTMTISTKKITSIKVLCD